jgi:hypothetical protein
VAKALRLVSLRPRRVGCQHHRSRRHLFRPHSRRNLHRYDAIPRSVNTTSGPGVVLDIFYLLQSPETPARLGRDKLTVTSGHLPRPLPLRWPRYVGREERRARQRRGEEGRQTVAQCRLEPSSQHDIRAVADQIRCWIVMPPQAPSKHERWLNGRGNCRSTGGSNCDTLA